MNNGINKDEFALLPFGLRPAPAIFNSDGLISLESCPQLGRRRSITLHDDYITFSPAGSDVCARRLDAIDAAAQYIGVPLSPEKCEGPSTCLTFLGIE